MVDELFELVLGEEGFDVEVQCDRFFNDAKYTRIKELLSFLINEWQGKKEVPKKAMLAIVGLMICLVGVNQFLNEKEALKLEDASIEIERLLSKLYDDF